MKTERIAVFDVCGTITRTNNTFDFIRFVLVRGSVFRYGLLILIRLASSLFRLLRVRSLSGRDLLRDAQVSLLRGYSPARITEMAERYVDDLFTRRLMNDRILEALEREREQGRTLFLVSAAIDPPIAAIAGRLGIENFFCSELEVRDGSYTGRLRTDLLGRKESILEKLSASADLQDSSVYSDNIEDAGFLGRFGRRNLVLNTSGAKRAWAGRGEGFHFLVNYDERSTDKDVHSIDESVVKWVYVPPLYYIVSRFHREGLLTLFFRELIPVTLVTYAFTPVGAFSLVMMPLSFLMFYSVYDIGGLVNDLLAGRETAGKGTHRISPKVRIHTGLFILIRVVLVGLLLSWLSTGIVPALLYAGALGVCTVVYLIHSMVVSNLRVLTFVLLKLCRNVIPLMILAGRIPPMTLVWLCAIFFILDAPWRVYAYGHKWDLAKTDVSVWRFRCITVAVAWVLGAVVYLATGPSHLLLIASYYVALDCLWIIRGR